MTQRWLFVGLAASSLAAMSLSAVDVAAQAPKVVPKPGLKPPKLDLSQLKVYKYDPALAPPKGGALDGPKIAAPGPVPELAEHERTALRERLAGLLDIAPAALPEFKRAPQLKAPGDTLVLDLGAPLPDGVVIDIYEPTGVQRSAAGPTAVHLVGLASPSTYYYPSIFFTTPVEPGRTYLYTCHLATDLTAINVSVSELSGQTGRGVVFNAPVLQGNKLLVPYQTGPDTRVIRFGMLIDLTQAYKYITLSRCELTLVR